MIISNSSYFRMLQAHSRRRRMSIRLSDRRATEIKNAGTLLCIAVSFIICQGPKLVPDVYEAFNCNHDLKVVLTILVLNYDIQSTFHKDEHYQLESTNSILL